MLEGATADQMKQRYAQYERLARTTKGAVLMCVCRGRASEGIDFVDELARAVILVGVPYPPIGDRKVYIKTCF